MAKALVPPDHCESSARTTRHAVATADGNAANLGRKQLGK